jgi:hypothetical protein
LWFSCMIVLILREVYKDFVQAGFQEIFLSRTVRLRAVSKRL